MPTSAVPLLWASCSDFARSVSTQTRLRVVQYRAGQCRVQSDGYCAAVVDWCSRQLCSLFVSCTEQWFYALVEIAGKVLGLACFGAGVSFGGTVCIFCCFFGLVFCDFGILGLGSCGRNYLWFYNVWIVQLISYIVKYYCVEYEGIKRVHVKFHA